MRQVRIFKKNLCAFGYESRASTEGYTQKAVRGIQMQALQLLALNFKKDLCKTIKRN